MKPQFKELEFNLDFFARLIQVPRSSVSYGLLHCVEGELEVVRPVVKVRGIVRYVFDICSVQFVGCQTVYEHKRTLLDAGIFRSKKGYRFVSADGKHERELSVLDFLETYKSVVANPLLTN